MGYKKIQAKREELSNKKFAKQQFLSAAESLVEICKQIGKTKSAIQQKMASMNTAGVPEFESYKKSILALTQKMETLLPPSLDPIHRVVDEAEDEVERMVQQYQEKLLAAFPGEVKVGMTFKDKGLKRVCQIMAPGVKSPNLNLQGDDAMWFKVHYWNDDGKDGSDGQVKLSDLKKMKYLNTM
jgi:hypothetical protein